MTDPLAQVAPLIDRAKLLRSQQQLEPALRFIQQAVDGLQSALTSHDAVGVDSSEVRRRLRGELAHKLADCYGIRGGILRRQNLLADAAKSYELGAAIEQDPQFGIVDSYNLTNSLLLKVLAMPETLNSDASTIARARDMVALQVTDKRRSQWWAWADLGLLSLFSGEVEQARHAYHNFQSNGARAADYDSTISVLRQSYERVHDTHPDVAERIREAIGWLETDRPQV